MFEHYLIMDILHLAKENEVKITSIGIKEPYLLTFDVKTKEYTLTREGRPLLVREKENQMFFHLNTLLIQSFQTKHKEWSRWN